jgi:hypothetical protein
MAKFVWAVVVSNLIDIVGSIAVIGILGYIIVDLHGGDFRILTEDFNINIFLATLDGLISIGVGYLAAEIAKDKYLLMGGLSSILSTLQGMTYIFFNGANEEAVILLFLTPVLGVLGGFLYVSYQTPPPSIVQPLPKPKDFS